MLLGDIAQVKEDHQPLIGDAVVGQDAGLLLVVEKFPGTSALQVTKDIEAALNDMQPGLSGIQMDTSVFRPASFLQDAVDGLGVALLVSLLIAVLLFWAALPLLAGRRDRPRGHHHHRHGGRSRPLLARLHTEHLDPRRHLAGRFRDRGRHRGGCAGAAAPAAAATETETDATIRFRMVRLVRSVRTPLFHGSLIMALALVPTLFVTGVGGAFFQPLFWSLA